jgi:hypothetical protein
MQPPSAGSGVSQVNKQEKIQQVALCLLAQVTLDSEYASRIFLRKVRTQQRCHASSHHSSYNQPDCCEHLIFHIIQGIKFTLTNYQSKMHSSKAVSDK